MCIFSSETFCKMVFFKNLITNSETGEKIVQLKCEETVHTPQ